MYAFTDKSFRMIASADDAAAHETVGEEVPASTLREIERTLRENEVRNRIAATNWAMVEDADVSTIEKNAIRAYRASLRALVNHPDFPDIPWPQLPSTSGVGNETGEQS